MEILPDLPALGARVGYSRAMQSEEPQGQEPRLHIDSDWKAQAQAEKERLAQKESARAQHDAATGDGTGEGEMPPASFQTLVATLANQAIMGLGAYRDPQTGGVMIDLVGAQFAIDLLGVLEEKTKGNLSAEESTELHEVLVHLRARFVQVAKVVAAQMQRDMQGGLGGAVGGVAGAVPASATAKPGLIIPE